MTTARSVVILDFDGVLVDTVELKGELLACVLSDIDTATRNEVLEFHTSHPSLSAKKKIEFFLEKQFENSVLELEVNARLSEFRRQVLDANVLLREGFSDLLSRLSNNFELRICSAAARAEVVEILTRSEALQCFSEVHCDVQDKGKSLANQKLECRKIGKAITSFVGDTISDQAAAEYAKIPFIGFSTPDYIACTRVSCIEELERLLMK